MTKLYGVEFGAGREIASVWVRPYHGLNGVRIFPTQSQVEEIALPLLEEKAAAVAAAEARLSAYLDGVYYEEGNPLWEYISRTERDAILKRVLRGLEDVAAEYGARYVMVSPYSGARPGESYTIEPLGGFYGRLVPYADLPVPDVE